MKKYFCSLLVLLIIASSFSVMTVSAAARYVYDILPSGGISLKSYMGSGTEKVLKIPEAYEGHPVTALNFDELNDITYVRDIYIPKTVKKISSNAFGGSCFLENIYVDEANPYFASNGGVLYNKNFTQLICYPNTKKDRIFTVPETVKIIKEKAFELTILSDIILPEGLTKIENKAFWYSIYLERVNLPSTLTSIGENAFCNCMKLDNVVIPEGVKEIKTKTFDSCSELENIVIPESVHTIGEKAFMFCRNLQNLVLPKSLIAIDGGNPFIGDTSLNNLTVQEGNPYFKIVDGALYSKDMTRLYYYPYLTSERYVNLPDGLINIDSSAFKGNVKVIGIKVPDSVRFVGDATFSETTITSISLPKGVERIGDMCFAGCKTLKKVTVPITLKSVGMSAFKDCMSITDVYYGGSKLTWQKVKVDPICNEGFANAKYHYAITIPTKVSLSYTSTTIYVKASKKLNVKVTDPVGKTTYKSSNIAVAMVNSVGKVTALKKGTATITVTNNGITKKVKINVKNPYLNKTKVSIRKGKTFNLKITGKVGTAKFSTSNKKVATVSSAGKITAKKTGSATISVKTNGITLKCKVTVY